MDFDTNWQVERLSHQSFAETLQHAGTTIVVAEFAFTLLHEPELTPIADSQRVNVRGLFHGR